MAACAAWEERGGSIRWLGSEHYSNLIKALIADDEKSRQVPWPDDAPDQDTVPRAGEIRIWRGAVMTVLHGVPWLDSTFTWCLFCITNNKTSAWVPVGDLEMPEPESVVQVNLYSLDDVFQAVSDLGYSGNLAKSIVGMLDAIDS